MNISKILLKETAISSNDDFYNTLNIILLLEKFYLLKRITKKIIQTMAPSDEQNYLVGIFVFEYFKENMF